MKKLSVFVFFILFCLSFSIFAHAGTFYRNLKQGDVGEDVRSLQIILNKDSDTKVANNGSGSTGNETNYFGAKTEDAIKRFQNKHKNDVLLPAGLTMGTGFVGENTRRKLDSFSNISQTIQTKTKATSLIPPPTTPSFVQAVLNHVEFVPNLYLVDPYQAKQGTKVVLHGESFSLSSNTVFIGPSVSIINLKSRDGSTIELTLPDISTLSSGNYEVWVTNSAGSSKNSERPIPVLITQTPKALPRIISVSPSSVSPSGIIIISGENFSANGNNIISVAGEIHNISSSDSKTMIVALSSFPYMSKIINAPLIESFKLSFVVQNENGIDLNESSVQVIIPK